ncbi:hypothetical protein GGU11DRAFT_252752 [Lentinula aff. detonsa]|nr:hypothetical protein GGU11DRAFT_252752 [Lentinula aff. detonsa]
MEEILSAYVAWKFIRGQSCALVMQKLRYLTIYLRVTGRQWVLERIRQVLMVIATELSLGGGLIGACPGKYLRLVLCFGHNNRSPFTHHFVYVKHRPGVRWTYHFSQTAI